MKYCAWILILTLLIGFLDQSEALNGGHLGQGGQGGQGGPGRQGGQGGPLPSNIPQGPGVPTGNLRPGKIHPGKQPGCRGGGGTAGGAGGGSTAAPTTVAA